MARSALRGRGTWARRKTAAAVDGNSRGPIRAPTRPAVGGGCGSRWTRAGARGLDPREAGPGGPVADVGVSASGRRRVREPFDEGGRAGPCRRHRCVRFWQAAVAGAVRRARARRHGPAGCGCQADCRQRRVGLWTTIAAGAVGRGRACCRSGAERFGRVEHGRSSAVGGAARGARVGRSGAAGAAGSGGWAGRGRGRVGFWPAAVAGLVGRGRACCRSGAARFGRVGHGR